MNKQIQLSERAKTITITISKKIWKKLAKLKIDKDFKSYDEALEFLFKKK